MSNVKSNVVVGSNGVGNTRKGNVQMGKKIQQKVQHIVKGESFFPVYLNSEGITLEERGSREEIEIYVSIVSGNPFSPYYSQYMVSTGMLDSHLPVQHIKQARVDKNNGRTELVSVNKDLAVDRYQLAIETGGESLVETYVVNEDNLGSLRQVMNLTGKEREAFVSNESFEDFVGKGSFWKVGARSASQRRKGDLVMIPGSLSLVEHIEGHLKFDLRSYAKSYKEKLKISVTIQSRLKMSASSGKPIDLFKGFKYIDSEPVEYIWLDGKKTLGMEYTFLTKGRLEKFLVLEEDFTVRLEQEVTMPSFGKGAPKVVSRKQVFEKPATDGSSYIDMDFALRHGVRRDLQFRLTPVIKGMLNSVSGLKDKTGYLMILFGGAVKGNPAPYFKKSELEAYVLGTARDEKELNEDYLMLSNQAVRDMAIRSPKSLKVLERDTKELLRRAYAQDIDALRVFIGLKDETEVEEKDEEEVQLDSENLTVSLFYANEEVFMKSDAFKKRLNDFIRPASKDVEYAGRYYAQDTSYRHMVSDPYEVVRHLVNGHMAIDMTVEGADIKGIAPGHVVTNSLRDGVFKLDDRKAVLTRFPLLHNLEIQVVNDDGATFLDTESRVHYENLMASGKHQGVIYYSLYDMTAEAQSGADFDGDTTVVVRNPEITELFSASSKYLDYSLLDGELVEGVPWKTVSKVKLDTILTKEEVEYLDAVGVEYVDGDFILDGELLEKDEVRELIYKTIVNLDGLTNESNNIGQFTNINASITELLTVLINKQFEARRAGLDNVVKLLEDEIEGYEKLNFLLASAIRWEIDKAKHGGAFYEKLPFLEFLLNADEEGRHEMIGEFEQGFGISLYRLFQGYEKMNDAVNKGLISAGIAPIHLERAEGNSSQLNLSRSLYLAKGIDKGTKYGSRYDKYIEELQAMSSSHTAEFKINETKNGLLNEAIAFMQRMYEEGYGVQMVDSEGNKETLYTAKMDNLEGMKIDSPAKLLSSYRKKVKDISDKIGGMESRLIARLESNAGGKILNSDNLGLEALMKKAKVSEEERLEGYELLAKKELIIDEHKGLGEAFTSNDPKESALLFAELYEANVRSQRSSRSEKLENQVEVAKLNREAREHLHAEWKARFGEATPTVAQKANIEKWVAEYIEENIYSDTGWGSILTLFPLGAVQFLEFIGSGEITTDSMKGRNTVVYLKLKNGGMIPSKMKEAFKKAEGRRVEFVNGEWSGLVIDREDLSGMNKSVNVSDKELENLVNVERYDEVKNMKFERGAHLWNRSRNGKIVLAVVYREGVKLFLEDSQEVAGL